MTFRANRIFAFTIVSSALVASSCADLQPKDGAIISACFDGDSDPTTSVSFEKDIRPIMNGDVPGTKGCKSCHYDDQPSHIGLDQSGLNLTELEYVRMGGNNTHDDIIVAGKPCESAIVQKLHGSFHIGARMPKDGPFWTDAQIRLMADWIAEGAIGDDDE